ncbi:MAG TPA: bifunctional ADP-heptose synthase [Vicinamibacteria bacterium]|nr:bifunctional ADP-heptose synthase [Vicinamibacteria bacterium]
MRGAGPAPPPARLADLIHAFRGRRVLVLADLVADEFVYGRVQRVSREAPVLILEHDGAEVRLGGGANAVHNIRTLGGTPLPLGILGADTHGRQLRALLREKGVATARVLTGAGYRTPVKTRILAGGAHSTKQQVVRIDRATRLDPKDPARRAVRRALDGFRGRVDGVLVSDYGFGLLTPDLVQAAITFARRRAVPVTVDSRHGLLAFRGMTAVTPNEPEVEAALGITIGHDHGRLEAAGRTLIRRLGAKAVLITRGSDGMALFEPGRATTHIPIHGSDQVADVTGAGDTVIATFTLALAAGANPAEASVLANVAGGIVVMKRATSTVSAAELLGAVAPAVAGAGGAKGVRTRS